MLVSVAKKRLFSSVRSLANIDREMKERIITAIAIKLISDMISLKNRLRDSIVDTSSFPTDSIPKVGFSAMKASMEATKQIRKDEVKIDTNAATA